MRQTPQTRGSRRPAAFTIVEMLMVLLILGIVAAAATPTFYRSLVHHRLESAARRVKLDLEQSRHAARVKSQGQSMSFTGATYTLSSGVEDLDSSGQTYTVDLAETPYELDSVTADFAGATSVSFDGYGTASADGTILLELGDESRTVSLENSNGQITITDP
jgi:type II secretion system protein H